MSDAARDILTNAEVVAMDQDPAGLQGNRVAAGRGGREVWVRRLAGGDRALLFFNRGRRQVTMRFFVRRLGLAPARTYRARDVWTHRTHTVVRWIRAQVPRHGVALFRVSPAH